MSFSVQLTKDDITPSLRRLAAAGRNTAPVMRAMGTTFMSITIGNFSSHGAQYRPSPGPAKRDGTPSNLKLHGDLSKAFHLTVTNTTATVGNPKIYARIHQLGGTIKAKAGGYLRFMSGDRWFTLKQVIMPARPFFPVLTASRQVGDGGSVAKKQFLISSVGGGGSAGRFLSV